MNGSQSSKRYAVIAYINENDEERSAKIAIAKRHLKSEYKNGLPILLKHGSAKPMINKAAYVYLLPVMMVLILLIGMVVYAIIKMN